MKWVLVNLTCSAVFNRFSISKLLVRLVCLTPPPDCALFCGSVDEGAGELSTSGENISLPIQLFVYLFFVRSKKKSSFNRIYSLHPGAGTIKPEIISSLIIGGSDGGGGHTNESIISSVTRMIPTKSGGSVRDDLRVHTRVILAK